ncbi:MAG: cysteine--tRNA ligase, partial [Melioribacteraceae bacterium]|nr:cysteine--tRNA ligase [Melioribacteraceae bacterium]
TLEFNDYKVKYIMNLTDLGHLTDDADEGEDKLEIAAEKEGKSAREVADFYIKAFFKDYDDLNLRKPSKFPRATDYIKEQVDLIQRLENEGYTYITTDGVYFDTAKFENYGKLSGFTLDNIKEGARVTPNLNKKNPSDFALWKFSNQDKKRWQEYDSPWGMGFPGWHIECSAMALSELGDTLDIHIGGEDHKMIHHPNEIAQSECATGKNFVNYWVHVTHLQVDAGKMAKSSQNFYTIPDIVTKGFTPMDLRFFYMTAHYRSPLNFTWEALQNSHNSLKKLYDLISGYEESEDAQADKGYLDKFNQALLSDLNLPKAIAIVWDLVKSNLDESTKILTLLSMDDVLGLKIEDHVGFKIPQKVQNLAKIRWEYRKQGIFDKADQLRREVSEMGYVIEDGGDEYKIKRKL